MSELNPCPFDGTEPKLVYDGGNEVYGQSWQVCCGNCGASQRRHWGSNSWAGNNAEDDKAKNDAITAWNTRTGDPK